MGYLYTDSLEELSPYIAIELFTAADFYTLDRLKELCEYLIRDKIEVSNAPLLLKIADEMQVMHIRSICMEFVIGKFEVVSRSLNFGELPQEIILEILRSR